MPRGWTAQSSASRSDTTGLAGVRQRRPASGVRHPASGIRHPAGIGWKHQASTVGIRHAGCRLAGMRYPDSATRSEDVQHLLEALLAQASDHAVLLFGVDQRIKWASKSAEVLLGTPAEQLVGVDAGDLFLPEDVERGIPELELEISLMPTGEVIGAPKLLKGSGMAACDAAVVRAILQSQPLPVPPQAELFARFRDLRLKVRPNE